MNNNKKIGALITTVFLAFATIQIAVALILMPLSFAYTSTQQKIGGNVVITGTCGLDTPSNTAMFFGSTSDIAPGQNTGAAANDNYTYLSDTNGNKAANVYEDAAGNWVDPGVGAFNAFETNFAATKVAYTSALMENVSSAFDNTNIIVNTGGAAGRNVIYFGLGIPPGIPAGTYTQTINLELQC